MYVLNGWPLGVFLAKKWVDEVIGITSVSDRMIVIKGMVCLIFFLWKYLFF